ncbi:MAG: hypothetical protein GXY44_06885 [Phycisphaerales bacterium]|nr:hypothetical protein [Phycisphaerales bacterium]
MATPLVDCPREYRWSSASAHLAGRDDTLVKFAPLLEMVGDWNKFLAVPEPADLGDRLRHHESTGHPLGTPDFLARIELILNRVLKPRKPGRKPKTKAN